jgi:hypothetical protein
MLDGMSEPLKSVVISNFAAEEDTVLNADFPVCWKMSLTLVCLSSTIVGVMLSTLFLPDSIVVSSATERLKHYAGSDYFGVHARAKSLRPASEFVTISLIFNELEANIVNLSGNIRISCSRDLELLRTLTTAIAPKTYPVFNHSTGPILLVADDVVDFDEIFLELNLSSFALGTESVIVELRCQNTLISLSSALIRIIYAIVLLPSVISHIFKRIHDYNYTLEQNLTLILSIVAFFYLDPFYGLQLIWPSALHHVALLLLRDFFTCYVAFYVLALLIYFGRDPDENQLLSLAFPYLYFLLSSIILLISDASIPLTDTLKVFPDSFVPFDANSNTLYFTLLCLIFIASLILAFRRCVKAQENRIWFYARTITPILVFLTGVQFVTEILPKLQSASIARIIPLCFFTLFVILMDNGHQRADLGTERNFEGAGESREIADIGADADPQALDPRETGW